MRAAFAGWAATVLVVLVVVPGAACRRRDNVQPPAVERHTLAQMAVMARGEGLDDKELTAVTVALVGDAALDAYVQRLVTDPKLADVAAAITFKQTYATDSYPPWKQYVLKTLTDQPAPVFWLHEQCKPADAVDVHPWWAMETTVKVCPEAHRPEQKDVPIPNAPANAESKVAQCSSIFSAAQGLCGCGENLQRCARDAAHRNEIRRASYAEIRETIADNIARDRPIAEIFTSNETVRSREAEALYRRWDAEAGFPTKLEELASFPDGFVRRPRAEHVAGQHAGLLSTPKLLHYNVSHRGRLMQFFEVLWCSEHTSKGVQPEAMLGLGGNGKDRKHATNLEISTEGWQEITKQPACTGCHARMDYGVQFWLGYDGILVGGMQFLPKLARAGKGPIYSNNADDLRGEGELNPATFAKLVTAEPEFGACMVDNVATAILGDAAGEADVAALKRAFAEQPTFKSLMTVALKRYAQREAAANTATIAPQVAGSGTKRGKHGARPPVTPDDPAAERIALGPDLVRVLENECVSCHEEGLYDETSKTMARDKAARSLEYIAFETMPKDKLFEPNERNRIAQLFIERLWHEQGQRDDAQRYFVGRFRPRTVLPITSATRVIGLDTPSVAKTAERGIYPEHAVYTPGFVAITAVEAVTYCRNASVKAVDFEDCVASATVPSSFFRGSIRPERWALVLDPRSHRRSTPLRVDERPHDRGHLVTVGEETLQRESHVSVGDAPAACEELRAAVEERLGGADEPFGIVARGDAQWRVRRRTVEDRSGRPLFAQAREVAAQPRHELPRPCALMGFGRQRALRLGERLVEVLGDRARLGEGEVAVQQHGHSTGERSPAVRRVTMLLLGKRKLSSLEGETLLGERDPRRERPGAHPEGVDVQNQLMRRGLGHGSSSRGSATRRRCETACRSWRSRAARSRSRGR